MRRFAPTLLLLLGACTAGNRGMVTTHQPIVKGDTAYVPGCPDWSTASAQAHEGQSSNYGCATMTNLAAMIANPQDLLHGRSDAAGNRRRGHQGDQGVERGRAHVQAMDHHHLGCVNVGRRQVA